MIPLRRILEVLASLRLTLALLLLAAALSMAVLALDASAGPLMVVPCVGLFLNLLAALAVNPRLKRQTGLLVFHLGLAALALLIGLGQVTRLKGTVELAEGAGFSPELVDARPARLHRGAIGEVLFVQGPLDIEFAPGMWARHVRSNVGMPDGRGGLAPAVVSQGRPLLVNGYRFSVTTNKGFAPVLTYTDANGVPSTGAVHMPPYPRHADRQATALDLPDGSASLIVWLSLAAPLHQPEAEWRFATPQDATVVLDDGERRLELRQGEAVPFGAGTLRYERVTAWMGYAIFYDPTLPWLVAAGVVAAAGLLWHAVAKLRLFLGSDGPLHAS